MVKFKRLMETRRDHSAGRFGWLRSLVSRSRSLVGVDIGSRAMKLVELRVHSKGYALVKCGMRRLNQSARANRGDVDKAEIIATLQELTRRLNLSGKDAALSLSGPGIFSKRVTVPLMSMQELENHFIWENRHYLPSSFEDACWDFHVLPDVCENQAGTCEQTVLLVAAKRAQVERCREVLEAADLVPAVLDMTGLALYQTTCMRSSGMGLGPTLVMNCEVPAMNMAVIHHEVPLLLRDISMDGRELVGTIQAWRQCTETEAEQLLFDGSEDSLSKEEKDTLYAGIIGEAQRTLDHCEKWADVAAIPRQVVVYGGLAKAPGFLQRLQNHLGLSVELGDPLQGMDVRHVQTDGVNVAECAHELGVAVGLACRKRGE